MAMRCTSGIWLGVVLTLSAGTGLAGAATSPGNGVAASPVAAAKAARPALFARFPDRASTRSCRVLSGTPALAGPEVTGRCETHVRYVNRIGNPAVVTFVERWNPSPSRSYSISWSVSVSAGGRVTTIREAHSASSNGMAPGP
jgi:hypothetical protein